jgi:YHS domain-containing protein
MSDQRILDPICNMIVELAEARDQGLTIVYPEREYGFCSAGCQAKFAKNPAAYVSTVESWLANRGVGAHATEPPAHAHTRSGERPEIDAGMRAWYSACRCCLSDAYPAVVEALDRERATIGETPIGTGICETAESHETKAT